MEFLVLKITGIFAASVVAEMMVKRNKNKVAVLIKWYLELIWNFEFRRY
jgi:hypothetical protein